MVFNVSLLSDFEPWHWFTSCQLLLLKNEGLAFAEMAGYVCDRRAKASFKKKKKGRRGGAGLLLGSIPLRLHLLLGSLQNIKWWLKIWNFLHLQNDPLLVVVIFLTIAHIPQRSEQ